MSLINLAQEMGKVHIYWTMNLLVNNMRNANITHNSFLVDFIFRKVFKIVEISHNIRESNWTPINAIILQIYMCFDSYNTPSIIKIDECN